MTIEPTRVDIDEEGNEIRRSKKQKVKSASNPRAGKTELQQAAVRACYPTALQFADREEHQEFREFEAKAAGADPESRMWAAWLKHCVDWAKSLNRKMVCMKMSGLLSYMGNEDKRKVWFDKNRKEVLAKPTAQQLMSNMQQRMDTRIAPASELEADL